MTAKKPVVLTNLSSSSAEDISGRLAALFQRYGHGRPEILIGQSEQMEEMMDAMRAARGDLLVSFGGDGTASAVASIAREQGVPFIPLPGGTMNMLMQGLYGSDQWDDCLIRGLAARPRPMTAGIVSDETGTRGSFMVGCMFGKPTRMSEAREELRDGNVPDAVSGALDTLKTTTVAAPIHIAGGEDGPFSEAGMELVNVTAPFMDGEALDPNVLDLTLFETVTGGSTLSLGMAALMGNLRQSQAVEHVRTPVFRLRSDQFIEGLLDGEPMKFSGEVTVRLDTDHGLVRAPWPSLSFPTAKGAT